MEPRRISPPEHRDGVARRATPDRPDPGMHGVIAHPLFAPAFLALFLVVDHVTFVHQAPALNLTPWNPPAGLYVALLLAAPPRHAIPLTFVALMLGDLLVRGGPAPLPLLLATNLAITAAYAVAATVLRRRLHLHPALDRPRQLIAFVAITPLAAAAAALGFVAPYALAGTVPWHGAVQYWAGDVIGVLAVAPAVLVALHGTQSDGPRVGAAETLAQAVAVPTALWLTFGPLAADPSKLYHLLFLPVVWIALRRGLPGAAAATLGMQVGVVLARPPGGGDIFYDQLLMAALTATGLLVGAIVGERWRLDAALRRREAELARVARLSLLGEMASSLAHELNQPLFTTINYTKSSRALLLRDGGASTAALDLMGRAVAEAERAAEVLRGIRGFLRQEGGAGRVKLAASVREVLALTRPDLQRHGITVTVDLPAEMPDLWTDKVQLDQVLLNLLRNSIDALAEHPGPTREIVVSAHPASGMAVVSVADSGPGVPADKIAPLFDLFFTTKPSGMGLGLPICRSLVESHGGRLWLDRNGPDGACFSFTLPTATP